MTFCSSHLWKERASPSFLWMSMQLSQNKESLKDALADVDAVSQLLQLAHMERESLTVIFADVDAVSQLSAARTNGKKEPHNLFYGGLRSNERSTGATRGTTHSRATYSSCAHTTHNSCNERSARANAGVHPSHPHRHLQDTA